MLDAWLVGDPVRRSRLAWLLTLYAVVGLIILALVGAGMTLTTVKARETLAQLELQRESIVRLLDATARSLESADGSADRLTTTLGETSDSIARGAGLARAVATAAQGVVAASGLEILGQRPLSMLGDTFGSAAEEATALADSLDATGASLTDTVAGVEDLSEDLSSIGEELGEIRETVAEVDLGSGRVLDVALAVGLLLLLWLAVPALSALWLARRLRHTAIRYAAAEGDAPRS
ncbi:MAG: hypothetical protein M3472_06615 [Chloroflexota bacterium]|nr:hypothetical protein [Chloroflexota bacterium]